jgi:hypothetical protein
MEHVEGRSLEVVGVVIHFECLLVLQDVIVIREVVVLDGRVLTCVVHHAEVELLDGVLSLQGVDHATVAVQERFICAVVLFRLLYIKYIDIDVYKSILSMLNMYIL